MMRRALSVLFLTLVLQSATLAHAQNAEPAAPPAPSTKEELERPLILLVPNLLRDLRRLASVDTAIMLGIGGGITLATYPADDTVTEHATAGGDKQFFEVGNVLGSGWTQIGGAVGTFAVGAIARKRPVIHLGSDLIRAQALNGVLTQGLKFAVQRQRPGATDSSSYSFPSGHTSSTFATAAVVWRHFGWKAGVPASAVGAWVGAARVQLKRHFLSDVVFGAAIGTVAGRTVTIGHGRRTIVVAPAAVPRGAALMFTLIER
jgi:membrane-associated phospholipid phosphatase